MTPDEINTLIAVGGTLGGVAVGGVISGVLAHISRRHHQSDQRDAQFTALAQACIRLVTEARLQRSLNSTSNKLRQAIYGAIESDALDDIGTTDLATFLPRIGAGAIVHGLRYLWPVEQAGQIRTDLLPMLTDVIGGAANLSMYGDRYMQSACENLGNIGNQLLMLPTAEEPDYLALEDAMGAALAELRAARDHSALSQWRHPRRRKKARARLDSMQKNRPAVMRSTAANLPVGRSWLRGMLGRRQLRNRSVRP
jgi:hypothetical protein